MSKNLPLQTSQAQWKLDQDDNQWVITDEDNEPLIMLPANLDERQVAAILRFARKYEKEAFEYGTTLGNDAMLAANSQRMIEMQNKIMVLEHFNDDLSNKLEIMIGNAEE